MTSEFYCKSCDITLTGKAPYDQHIQGAKHLKKIKASESLPTNINRSISSQPPTTPSVVNPTNFNESTISTTSFSIGAETMRILLEWNHPDGHRPYCDICYLPLHGDGNASAHFANNNTLHYNRLAIWKKIQEENPSFSCRVCSEIFPNENNMRDHFSSTVHCDRTRDKEAVQKFIKIYQTYSKLKEVRSNRIAKEEEEANSGVDNQFLDKFQNMTVIDSNTEPKSPSVKFNGKMLEVTMRQVARIHDDDDDDDY